MMVANPVVGYISKAFWAMYHANVTSAESLGWFIEFLQWKNWLIVYGFVLLPVMYMWPCPISPDTSDGMMMPGEKDDDTQQKNFH